MRKPNGCGASMSSEDLGKYLEKMGVSARFFNFEEHTMTVDAAVNRLGVSREMHACIVILMCRTFT